MFPPIPRDAAVEFTKVLPLPRHLMHLIIIIRRRKILIILIIIAFSCAIRDF